MSASTTMGKAVEEYLEHKSVWISMGQSSFKILRHALRFVMSENVQNWVGRTVEVHDEIDPQPSNLMLATLGRDGKFKPGDGWPPLWHLLNFREAKSAKVLGRDGYPEKGVFLQGAGTHRGNVAFQTGSGATNILKK